MRHFRHYLAYFKKFLFYKNSAVTETTRLADLPNGGVTQFPGTTGNEKGLSWKSGNTITELAGTATKVVQKLLALNWF